ncbi:hypothetical protein IPA_09055 [Ignicoccus pacificus DSM 13166]|uniref:Uncharacterized protein n=1 Tax=Ignicoccus pacificus DSM 13166 TaxID=940294 RepID=A0A977KC05_9CREN|nr:hypothetical protein IPA_09055 [Ignicoccus pacificus DSM 13166]
MHPVALLGFLVGIIELIIGYIAIKRYREVGIDGLKLFALGVILLGIGQFLCKFIGHGILSLPESYAVGVPFKFIGLVLVIYSLLDIVGTKYVTSVTVLGIILGIVFMITSFYSLSVLGKPTFILFGIPHLLFLTLFPWIGAYAIYEMYKDSKDIGALTFSLGLFIYGLATIINVVLTTAVGLAMFYSMSIALSVRLIGLIVMLTGFFIER